MDALLYADRYPQDLSGLVLLDPGVAGTKDKFVMLLHSAKAVRALWAHYAACADSAKAQNQSAILSCAKQADRVQPEFSDALNKVQLKIVSYPYIWRTLLSESRALESIGNPTPDDRTLEDASRPLGDLPLAVVMRDEASENPDLPTSINHELWVIVRNADADLTELSNHGELITFKGSSHWVQLDKPEETVRVILNTAKSWIGRRTGFLGQPTRALYPKHLLPAHGA